MDFIDLPDRDSRPDRQQYQLIDDEPVCDKDGYAIQRFVAPPPEEFVCVVCTGVVRKPKECINCGLLLCSKCVSNYLESRRQRGRILGLRVDFSCPTCRHKAEPRVPSRVLLCIISELRVHCKHKAEGCSETSMLGKVKEHQKQCPFRAIRCAYCDARGSKEEFLQTKVDGRRVFSCSLSCQRTYEFRHLLQNKKREEAVRLYYSLLQETEHKQCS